MHTDLYDLESLLTDDEREVPLRSATSLAKRPTSPNRAVPRGRWPGESFGSNFRSRDEEPVDVRS
jgi:hypothetical protein